MESQYQCLVSMSTPIVSEVLEWTSDTSGNGIQTGLEDTGTFFNYVVKCFVGFQRINEQYIKAFTSILFRHSNPVDIKDGQSLEIIKLSKAIYYALKHESGNVIGSYFLTVKSVRQVNSISYCLNMSSIAEVHCWEHQAFVSLNLWCISLIQRKYYVNIWEYYGMVSHEYGLAN